MPTVFDRRAGLRWGWIAGLALVFIAAIGMLETFDERLILSPVLSMGFLMLLWPVSVMGFQASAVEVREGTDPPRHGLGSVLTGALVGGTAATMLAVFTWVLATFDLRFAFINLSPALLQILTFSREPMWLGATVMFGLVVLLGAVGGAVHLAPAGMRKRGFIVVASVIVVALFERVFTQILRQIRAEDVFDNVFGRSLINLVFDEGGLTWGVALLIAGVAFWLSGRKSKGRVQNMTNRLTSSDRAERTRWSLIYAAGVLVAVAVAPVLLGSLLSEILANVGLFLLMGLGLNIVVGLAGLLDLGYVAFFAVGAYTVGLLTSSQFGFEWSWWAALPVALVASAIAGLLVGIPVIRMRGDYLAIVTLGFGEIVRILFLSDWLKPAFGGAQGIINISPIDLGFTEVSGISPQSVLYFAAGFVAVAAWVSWAVQSSRVGRAWTAIREDESVAEVMGIDTVRAKLSAFVVGAILAGAGGALFAAKVGSIFPTSFRLLVSIIVLVIVIVGGMGSIRGVVVGAVVLIGVLGGPTAPGLLLEFADFKLLVVGALLIFMMLIRPEGLLPSVRRSRELHHTELTQDAWLDKAGEAADDASEVPG